MITRLLAERVIFSLGLRWFRLSIVSHENADLRRPFFNRGRKVVWLDDYR